MVKNKQVSITIFLFTYIYFFFLIPIGFRPRMVCLVYLADTGSVNRKYCKGDLLILDQNNKYFHSIKNTI